ncbi:MAG: cytochrome b/b6 domain-containing protein [Wenzhouxiangella sp.]
MPVWDLPTRLSHSALVILLCLQILSGQFLLLPTAWHLWLGYVLLLVVLFRVGWGLVGSESARFSVMIKSLKRLPAYLPQLFSRRPTRWAGHNPVGSLSSLVLIGLLLVSSLSGLFIETWGEYRGPLAERISRDLSLFLGDVHSVVRWPLYALVAVHILAAVGYWVGKRENRIEPIFISGTLALDQTRPLAMVSTSRAWLVLAVALALVALIAFLGPIY